jgi:23S rRNA (pseudouridine1915-N3)-methyltransferase
MFKVILICVGTLKEPFLRLGVQEYEKRLNRFVQLSTFEINETVVSQDQGGIIKQALMTDGALIKKAIPKQAYVVVLDLKGSTISSESMAEKINIIQQKNSHVVFIIGGSHGLDQSIKTMAHETWSFSSLTFPHQLFRLMFLEQLYRSMTIIAGHPYHK